MVSCLNSWGSGAGGLPGAARTGPRSRGRPRGGGDQHRRLHLDEPWRSIEPRMALAWARASQVALHALASGRRSGGAGAPPRRRRCGRRPGTAARPVQDLDRALPQLDLAGGQRRVGGALGPGADHAGHPHTHSLRVDRAVDRTGHPLAVPEVEEGQVLAVLRAATRQPHSDTVWPACSGRSSPHQWCAGPRRAGSWSAVPPGWCGPGRRPGPGTICCSARPRSRTVAVPVGASRSPRSRPPGRRATRRLHLGLVERPS